MSLNFNHRFLSKWANLLVYPPPFVPEEYELCSGNGFFIIYVCGLLAEIEEDI